MTMIVRDGRILQINTPLKPEDIDALIYAFRYPMGTVIYVPFDPYTFQIPTQRMNYKFRTINGQRVVYSPNVWDVMMKYYAKEKVENNRKVIEISKIPILIVDYKTPVGVAYIGKNKPPNASPTAQYYEWKSGYMISRVHLPNDAVKNLKVQVCTSYSERLGCLKYETLQFEEGWYGAKYEARLIELPSQVMMPEEQVLKFYYKRPNIPLKSLPGVNTVVDYIAKRKLSGKGLQQIKSMLLSFGLIVDENYTYKTDSGKTVKGPHVEGTKDGYVVYLPVKRAPTASLGPEISGVWIAIIIIALTILAFASYMAYKITSNLKRPYEIPMEMTKNAENFLLECRKQCDSEYNNDYNKLMNQYKMGLISKDQFEKGVEELKKKREACYGQCNKNYSQAVNQAQKMVNKLPSGGIGLPSIGLTQAIEVILIIIIIASIINLLRR